MATGKDGGELFVNQWRAGHAPVVRHFGPNFELLAASYGIHASLGVGCVLAATACVLLACCHCLRVACCLFAATMQLVSRTVKAVLERNVANRDKAVRCYNTDVV